MPSLLLCDPEQGRELLCCPDDHRLVSIDLDTGFRPRTPLASPHSSTGSFSIDMVVVPDLLAIVHVTSLAQSKFVATVATESWVHSWLQYLLISAACSAGTDFWNDFGVYTTCQGLKM